MSADTGVGPAIASGSQTYNGICALLPVQPSNRNRQMVVSNGPPAGSEPTPAATPEKSSVPTFDQIRNIAIRNPKSPMRFTMKAFLPASAFALSLNQNPISRYDTRPTPSHPTNITG